VKHPLEFLDADIARLEHEGLLRLRPDPWRGRPSFCSNDYLGLSARRGHWGRAGAGASRLVTGETDAHRSLEGFIAEWLSSPAVLAFSSGYATNVGLLSALVRPEDIVISDALNHASIIDGIRLSRAEVRVTPHIDVDAIEGELARVKGRRAFVVVESYYSMDADTPDLARLRSLTLEHDAVLIVDEAHALGILGPEGRGLSAAANITPDALVGTLGKAIGVQGGFVSGSKPLAAWLWNRARSFVFSTGMSPLVAHAAREHIALARTSEDARVHVATLAQRLRSKLTALGLDVRGHGHIVPWCIGEAAKTMRIATALRDRGFDVQAIRPPTVPHDTSRLRLTVTAQHAENDIDELASAIVSVV
jgi:8-amino-7-oxononanoate synthase